MSDLFLGIDIGTGRGEAVLTTADGEVVATASGSDGWVALSRELAEGLDDANRITGVCVSGPGPGLLVGDAERRPLRPPMPAGIDTPAGAVRWLREHEPETWARTTGFYTASSYAVAQLTGEYVLDHPSAGRHGTWSAEATGDVPLPRPAWPSEIAGTVTPDAARETGLPVGTPVATGTVDAWAAAFGAGVREPGDLMLGYGPAMSVVRLVDGPHDHPPLWTTPGVERGTHTLATALPTAGRLTAWLRELTGGAPLADLVAEAAAVPPGADGLTVLADDDPGARGLIDGLTLRHRRGHLFRAAYEGIAYRVRQILDDVEAAAGPPRRIVAVGGGAEAGLWIQIVSDVTGREQVRPAQAIGAAYGDALLAAIGTGSVRPDTDWMRVGEVIRPDPANAAVYDAN